MARFDVYTRPDPALRKKTPFLLDVQNTYIDRIATRVVVPMRLAEHFPLRMRDLNPVFDIGGRPVVMDTSAIAAIPVSDLKKPAFKLVEQGAAIFAAPDVLFGAY